jgi:hypothetical protein
VQLTTDGHKVYLEAVEDAFGCEIDNAILGKTYGLDPEKEKPYSSKKCIGAKRVPITGNPDQSKIPTSYAAAMALHFVYYNFGWVHRTLRVTPAMEACISDHAGTLDEIVGLAYHNYGKILIPFLCQTR